MSLKTRFARYFRHMQGKTERGSAALEFAIVAPVFFALMLGILEIGTMTFAQFALQNAITQTARLIRTGQAQNINPTTATQCMNNSVAGNYTTTADWYRGQICCNVSSLLNCSSTTLFINVSSSSSGFPSSSGGFSSAMTNVANAYSPGNACDVVLVQATYSWPIWFPGLAQLLNSSNSGTYLVNMTDGSGHLLSATAAFRNEPFTSGVSGC
jgi:Flp pilus assembly protein TadG